MVIYPLLQIAKLENNKLRSIPDSIGNLNSLQKLNLWKNQLEIFPESIGDLTALQDLDVRENKIKTFPESMVQMKDLKAFYIDPNMYSGSDEKLLDLLSTNLKNKTEWLRSTEWDILQNITEQIGKSISVYQINGGNRDTMWKV